jgi:hypothetical protein
MFSRCAVLGIIAGGFALTGDLSWFAAHGMRVINSRTVPTAEGPAPAVAPPSAPAAAAARAASAPEPPIPAPGSPVAPATDGAVALGPRPPTNGIDEAPLSALRAGDRIIVWLRGGGSQPGPCLALDVIDPASGEAIIAEVASLAANGAARTAGPPRRVVLGGSAGAARPSIIRRGAPLVVRPAGLAPAAGDESPGVVAALLVVPHGG